MENMEQKTEFLLKSAEIFQKKSTKLKWQQRCNSFKYWILALSIFAVVLNLIIWQAGGFE